MLYQIPRKFFNTCEDFLCVVVSGHIIAAAMKALGMKAMDDKPMANTATGTNPDNLWMLDEEERKKVLDAVCSEIVERFVDFLIPQRIHHREGWCVLIWKEIPWIGLFLFEISRYHTRGRWITCPSVLAVLVANILWNGPNQL